MQNLFYSRDFLTLKKCPRPDGPGKYNFNSWDDSLAFWRNPNDSSKKKVLSIAIWDVWDWAEYYGNILVKIMRSFFIRKWLGVAWSASTVISTRLIIVVKKRCYPGDIYMDENLKIVWNASPLLRKKRRVTSYEIKLMMVFIRTELFCVCAL